MAGPSIKKNSGLSSSFCLSIAWKAQPETQPIRSAKIDFPAEAEHANEELKDETNVAS